MIVGENIKITYKCDICGKEETHHELPEGWSATCSPFFEGVKHSCPDCSFFILFEEEKNNGPKEKE